ncbi:MULTISPECIES: hypothetical protein [Brevibacterium]|uniref:Uncharacterized protein n=1 Tax=Brevibacterium pityocampae TaxID=506594 RepID=A0ABP8JFF7_9MICO|nr:MULTISPECIES: hypothetical protein [Actinomycetes]MCK1803660.1 hypothetical protein [Brevibacterium sp. R8603A2]MCX0276650.1 hypothetical protein [Nocardia zapadnayensis]QCP06000.1 hypothetical protein FDF13_12475 [Brevibacterium sp. CS2]
MSEFEAELHRHVSALRKLIASARTEGNDLAVDSLVGELEGLIGLAERNDVDTAQLQQVLAAETGAIPIVAPADEPS